MWGGSVDVLMVFAWRSIGVGMCVLGWGRGGVFGCVGGLVSEFWTRGIVYMLILTMSISVVC